MKKDFLPQSKPLRIVVQLAIAIIGIVAVVSGVRQMRSGVSQLSAEARVEVEGCRGISATTVQCNYRNPGTVKASACMDVVMICADGRHVAPSCSEPMAPGDSTVKQIDNFDPAISPATSCTSMSYEKTRAES